MAKFKKESDEMARSERTPFNIQADFQEIDRSFRERLKTMMPDDLSEQVKRILDRRFERDKKDEAV